MVQIRSLSVDMSPRRVPYGALIFAFQLACAAAAFRPLDKNELQVAVTQWLEREDVAEHISGWDTSMVTDMSS
eukprot:4431719-Amphidinium_carterae.1